MRIVVLADTHIRDGRPRRLPDPVWAAIDACELVLHAGDVVDRTLLDAFDARNVLYRAVLGNNDLALRGSLPARIEVDLAQVTVAMVHESGETKGRPARLRKWFPAARVVVFGHSHTPCNEWHDGQLLFNPGSPTERRGQPLHSYGVLELDAGRVISSEIIGFRT